MLVIIGYLIVIISVFGGFALAGGHLYALIQPIELLMIGGAAVGSFIVSNSSNIIKNTIKMSFSTLKGFQYSKKFYVQLLLLLFEISNKIKKEGVLSMEADIENVKESPIFKPYPAIQKEAQIMEFITDYLGMMAAGRVNKHDMENLMDQDIETFEIEHEQCINAINKVSDSMPAFGIVAAVMGVVHTMESMGIPPEQLGGLIAKALVGTFLGVLLGYGFIAPIAAILERKLEASVKVLFCIKVVFICCMNNFSPSIAVEFGRKILYSKERPNGKELEEIIKQLNESNSGA